MKKSDDDEDANANDNEEDYDQEDYDDDDDDDDDNPDDDEDDSQRNCWCFLGKLLANHVGPMPGHSANVSFVGFKPYRPRVSWHLIEFGL